MLAVGIDRPEGLTAVSTLPDNLKLLDLQGHMLAIFEDQREGQHLRWSAALSGGCVKRRISDSSMRMIPPMRATWILPARI